MESLVVEIERKVWDDMIERFSKEEVARRIALAHEETVIKIAAEAAEDAPRDTGMLAASIAWDVWGDEAGVWGKVFSPLPYASVMEYGREPGGPMPPAGELKAWMTRHGMDPANEYMLRAAIAERGIKPQPYLRPALEANQDYYLERLLYYLFDEEK